MPKTTKTFMIIWFLYMMGVHWGWWPLGGFVAGALCFAIVVSWLIVMYFEYDANQPERRRDRY